MTVLSLADTCALITESWQPSDGTIAGYLGLEHLPSGRLVPDGWDASSDLRSTKTRFRKGDVLYGKLRPYLDKAVIAPFDGICSTEILVLRPRSSFPPVYLAAVLHSNAFLDIAKATTTGVNHPRTSWSAISEFQWRVPPEEERRQIALAISFLHEAVRLEACMVVAIAGLKRSVLHQLFSYGLVGAPQKDTPYGPLPQSWDTIPLGECCTVQTGVTKGRTISGGEAIEVPYLRVANVQDGHLDLGELKTIQVRRDELDRFLLRDGDVVLTEGGDLDKLGRGFIWREEVANCVHQNHIFAVRPDRMLLDPEFLAYLVQSPYGKAYFLTVAHKTTNLASINSTKLKGFPVPLPSLSEQRDVAAALKGIDGSLRVGQDKSAALQEVFSVTLNDLITGRLAVSEVDAPTLSIEAIAAETAGAA